MHSKGEIYMTFRRELNCKHKNKTNVNGTVSLKWVLKILVLQRVKRDYHSIYAFPLISDSVNSQAVFFII